MPNKFAGRAAADRASDGPVQDASTFRNRSLFDSESNGASRCVVASESFRSFIATTTAAAAAAAPPHDERLPTTDERRTTWTSDERRRTTSDEPVAAGRTSGERRTDHERRDELRATDLL